jgi:hypothetical protein
LTGGTGATGCRGGVKTLALVEGRGRSESASSRAPKYCGPPRFWPFDHCIIGHVIQPDRRDGSTRPICRSRKDFAESRAQRQFSAKSATCQRLRFQSVVEVLMQGFRRWVLRAGEDPRSCFAITPVSRGRAFKSRSGRPYRRGKACVLLLVGEYLVCEAGTRIGSETGCISASNSKRKSVVALWRRVPSWRC